MWRITKSVVLMVASAALLVAQIDPPSRVGRLNYQEGPVSFQPTGINEWVDADINRPLTTGDNIWVGDRGRAEFHIGSTALRLSAYSDFQFLNLDDRTVQIRLSEGTLTVRLRNISRDQIFEVDTPNLAFTLNRPGEYRIDANPDSQTTVVTVRDGEGEITGSGQTFPIYARQRVVVRGDDQMNYNLASAGGPDDFDDWCSTRDRHEDQSQSARYVSRDIDGYSDLDQYGRWGDQPGYGRVWMPNSVDANWAPYHDGHWAWIAPWGWTWVDEAPWGFAPYHYGRWASFSGHWGWIPGPYGATPLYAPALVGWIGGGRGGFGFRLSFSIGTSAAVGWFPLGPREPYFPSYQVSQGYFTRVNNSNTVINTTTINNYYNDSRESNNRAISNIKYANRNVRNGVTAVPQATFAAGRRVTQEARAVPANELASIQVVAGPAIAPQRESVLGPRADSASRAPRPSANVLSRSVVARTAPPPAPVSFDQQRQALGQNPGHPLPATQVQQIRQNAPARNAPVRVVDMGRVKRVQPVVGDGGQGAAPRDTIPQPAAGGRQNGAPGQQRQQQPRELTRPTQAQEAAPRPQAPVTERRNGPPEQQQRQQDVQRGKPHQDVGRQQQPVPQPQPPVTEQRNVPPGQDAQRKQQQQELRRQNTPAPQPPVIERQNAPGRQQPPQQAAPAQAEKPQAPVVERQKGPPVRQQPPQQAAPAQAEKPQPAVVEKQNGRPGRQQPEVARPSAEQPQTPAAERQDRPDRGKKQGRQNEDDKK